MKHSPPSSTTDTKEVSIMASTNSTAITTAAQLKALKPKPSRYEIADKGATGLRIRVLTSGRKIFIWRIRSGTSQKLITIGEYPEMTLAQARMKLDKLKEQHADNALITGKRKAPGTVNELAEEFYTKRILPHRKRPDVVRQVLDADVLPQIGSRKLTTVMPTDITYLIEKVVDRGATTHAGKVLAIVKQMFKLAESNGYVERSPAYAHDPKNLGVTASIRNRFLAPEEISAFWSALEKAPRMSDPVRVAFRVLLLSGVRSGELRLAKWEHINFQNRTWFIPEENTKTSRAWTVPLPSHLIKHFKELKGYAGDSEWVVPGVKAKGKPSAPVTDKVFGRAMRRLFELEIDGVKILTIAPACPHDLRRTMRTHMSILKIEPYIAEKCLNHSLGKILETYDQNEMLAERLEALEKWGDYVDLIVNPRENVRRFQA